MTGQQHFLSKPGMHRKIIHTQKRTLSRNPPLEKVPCHNTAGPRLALGLLVPMCSSDPSACSLSSATRPSPRSLAGAATVNMSKKPSQRQSHCQGGDACEGGQGQVSVPASQFPVLMCDVTLRGAS